MPIKRSMFKRLFPALLISSVFATVSAHAQTASDTETRRIIVVLDASGSMWGRVQGRAKIEIAREVTRDFIKALPEDVELGLVAYGHRNKGDCKDIELLIPAGKVDRDLFIKKVDSLQPKGMTPLTDAVEFAAEALRFTEQKASVILVTDGEETCSRNPCEAAEKLEALGLDFTAHVIAFDLNDKAARSVECLASKTGGQFLKADDAATLADALSLALEAETTPMEEEELGEATLTVPAEAVIGSEFEVAWTGPDNKGDYITIVPAGAEDGQHKNYTYTRNGSPLKVTALMKAGPAEVRYMTSRSGKVLGRAAIHLTDAKVSLKAADKVGAGSTMQIEWEGPDNKGDYITVVTEGTEDGRYAKYSYTNRGNPVKVEVPLEAGVAEIRYMSGQDDKVLARRDILIEKAEVSLKAADKIIAGGTFSIEWTGPDNKGDYITIVTKDTEDGRHAKYSYTNRGNPVKVEAPLEAGAAEIRYMSGQGDKVLARRDILIEKAAVSLKAADKIIAGGTFSIEWTGPDNKGDYITVVTKDTEDGRYAKYSYTNRGNPVMVQTPLEPGIAEIRYMSGQGDKVLARREVLIEKAVITLKAPDEASAGSEVSVEWTGPDNKGDYITIVSKQRPDGEYADYSYTKRGSTLKIKAPDKEGEAEIRYQTEPGNKVLFRRVIKVTPAAETEVETAAEK